MMDIKHLFLTIYDCSDPVGHLRPKNVVYRKSVLKFCETLFVNRKDSRTSKFTIYDLLWNGGLASTHI